MNFWELKEQIKEVSDDPILVILIVIIFCVLALAIPVCYIITLFTGKYDE